MAINKVIKKWRKATDELAKVFTATYFPEEIFDKDTFWVSDEIGSVFCVSDMYFVVDRMIEALEHEASFEQIYDYADAELEHHEALPEDPMPINFKNYVKHGKKVDLKKSVKLKSLVGK